MKPLIGITSDYMPETLRGQPWNRSTLLVNYTDGIAVAGGAPVILPVARDAFVSDLVARLDGIILSGGACDVPPAAYGDIAVHRRTRPLPEERWQSEKRWLQAAREARKPILGVCLGMQVIGATHGAKLIQDLPDQVPTAHPHTDETRMYQHPVTILPGTWLAKHAPAQEVPTTSSHHQALQTVPDGFALTAQSRDGIIEGIESRNGSFLVAVQWHPERNREQPDWLLKAFIEECSKHARMG